MIDWRLNFYWNPFGAFYESPSGKRAAGRNRVLGGWGNPRAISIDKEPVGRVIEPRNFTMRESTLLGAWKAAPG